jgi:hypothetical protein
LFALLAIEEFGDTDDTTRRAVAAVALTVAASILLHGLTAGPGGRRYIQREHPTRCRAAEPASRAHPG